MNNYTIKLLTPAKRDLNEIKQFIKKDRPVVAKQVIKQILNEIAILEISPEAGVKAKDRRLRALGYRYLLVFNSKYLVFYVLYKEKKLVQIRRIFSTRQDYLRILRTDRQ